jgi:tetratricopeptide (TPR) repeat protein
MLGCWLAGYAEVVGISGVVAGYVGTLLVLELGAPEKLPAPMRLSRWLLFGAIALEATSQQWLHVIRPLWAPDIASFAHFGGFAAGALAGLALLPARRFAFVRVGAYATALATAVAFVWLGWALARPGDAAARRAQRLLQHAESIGELNNSAWQIATSENPSAKELEAAERMAERAVALTRRSDPNILDTLAEIYFVQGRTGEALDAIDEAIALAPGEPYFEEQRKRFTGSRAADDRPEPPEENAQPPEDELPFPELPPGDEVTV